MKVFNLLSGPRNISTAIMYSFAQRADMQVMDEPFYGYYLKHASNRIAHPSEDHIMDEMPCQLDEVIAHIQSKILNSNVFVKGMAHHILDREPNYLLDWENIILIRHPKKLIASFSKVIANPSLNDIGIQKAAQLFTFLRNNGKTPLVIDSDELMVNPQRYLSLVCNHLKMDFDPAMLSWEQGGIAEDGLWAAHWYANVHKTTGFQIQQKKPANIPPQLGPLLAAALPHYEQLKEHILINQ